MNTRDGEKQYDGSCQILHASGCKSRQGDMDILKEHAFQVHSFLSVLTYMTTQDGVF